MHTLATIAIVVMGIVLATNVLTALVTAAHRASVERKRNARRI